MHAPDGRPASYTRDDDDAMHDALKNEAAYFSFLPVPCFEFID